MSKCSNLMFRGCSSLAGIFILCDGTVLLVTEWTLPSFQFDRKREKGNRSVEEIWYNRLNSCVYKLQDTVYLVF